MTEAERKARRKEYMRNYARLHPEKFQAARNKYNFNRLKENPEYILSKEQSFVELTPDLSSPVLTPIQQLMAAEAEEIPETIKRIEAQNKVLVQQLSQLQKQQTELCNLFIELFLILRHKHDLTPAAQMILDRAAKL